MASFCAIVFQLYYIGTEKCCADEFVDNIFQPNTSVFKIKGMLSFNSPLQMDSVWHEYIVST